MREYEEVIVRLDKANTIIEEIVRCKDCRWYKDFDGCFFSTAEVEPLDYCSHGIRKSEEESVKEVVRGFMELVDATADRKTEPLDKDINVRSKTMRDCYNCERYENDCECIECHYAPKDEPQTEETEMDEYYKDHDEFYDCDRYVITNDEGERAYNCIGCEQTDCSWK